MTKENPQTEIASWIESMQIKAMGMAVIVFSRSSPSSKVTWFWGIISIFWVASAFHFNDLEIIWLWMKTSLVLVVVYVLLMIFKPGVHQSEQHTLENKRLDLELGDQKQVLPASQLFIEDEVVQPIPRETTKKGTK